MLTEASDDPQRKRLKVEENHGGMLYTTIPGTDLRVSRICLGTMQFSGSSDEGTVDVTWGSMSQETVNETVQAALDAGINFFDCAEAYGKDNCAERSLGIALKGRRSEVVLTSKFGKHLPLWDCDGLAEEQMYRSYSKADILCALDQSLHALQTDYIDLYQIHWPVNVGLLSRSKKSLVEVVEAMEEAKANGKVRYYGVCNFGTDDVEDILKAGAHIVTNQLPYNLLWRSLEDRILPQCKENRIGILCYSPLQQGLLTNKFLKPTDVPEGRRRTRLFSSDSTSKSRHGWPGGKNAQELLWQSGGVIENLRKISSDANEPLSMVAVAWLLAQSGVTSVIVGASSAAQVQRNARLVTLPVEVLTKCSDATHDLMRLVGGQIDQYAAVPRIHCGRDDVAPDVGHCKLSSATT